MWLNSIHYENMELLGEGAQGRVFKALRKDRHTQLSETVALKILHSETAVELWKREFESLRRVRSPYCVQVLSFDRVDGRPALILEYVDGISLNQLMRTCILENSDIREICAQIECALLDLHAFGVYHGDLSPANVLVDRTGQIRLLDFGLANGGGPNARLTPQFASPERLAGEAPSLLSDLYSLGCIESFLSETPLNQAHRPEYLSPEPSLRRPLFRRSDPSVKYQLGQKVDSCLRRAQWSRQFKTRTQQLIQPLSRVRSWIAIPTVALFALSTSSASLINVSESRAYIKVRANKWVHVKAPGYGSGYAPVDLNVPANQSVVLQWRTSGGRGQKTITLAPGSTLTLKDRDFSH